MMNYREKRITPTMEAIRAHLLPAPSPTIREMGWTLLAGLLKLRYSRLVVKARCHSTTYRRTTQLI